MTVDTTYFLQPGESIAQYNARIATYNASKGSPSSTPAPVSNTQQTQPSPSTSQQPPTTPPTSTPTPPPSNTVNYNGTIGTFGGPQGNTFIPSQDQPTQNQQTQQNQTTQPPQSNLQPGSQGPDVAALQKFLETAINPQTGNPYLTPQQVATGSGIYGPQTTAAVKALQQNLGVNAGGNAGYYGPQKQQAIAQKYQNIFSNVSSTPVPDSAAAASQQINGMSQVSTDPVFASMMMNMAPILESLSKVMNNINDPSLTGISLQQEYNQLATQNNLPALQSEMLNMQNVMNGTEDDIRDELTKAGGGATDSQVLAMTAARNKTILKQYNAVATQYSAASTNVQNLMQYAATDQSTALQKQQMQASVAESVAGIESQMVQMGMTMQQNARSAVQYNVTQTGYTGLAASAAGNPQLLRYYEQMLQLAPGTLSNPQSLAALDTYKQQQLAVAQENARNAANRTIIYAASQGVGVPGGAGTGVGAGGGTTFANGTTQGFNIPVNSLIRPSWLNPNVPLYMSADDAQQYISANPKKVTVGGPIAGSSQYGNNFDVQGIGHYIAQPDGSYILGSALPPSLSSPTGVQGLISSLSQKNPPTLNYSDIAAIMQNAPGSQYGPATTAFYREQRSARQLVGNFVNSPVYSTVSAAPLPFARIQAARGGDNSVSDLELVDSYITLAKGLGQITDTQVNSLNAAASVSDKLNIIKQKVAGAGALISTDQRKSLLSLAGSVFDQYSNTYQNLYTQAINVLAKNHIEPAVWGVIPDFSTMITSGDQYAYQQPQ